MDNSLERWPFSTHLPKEDVPWRCTEFKKRALHLLYRLSDAAIRSTADIDDIRAHQARFLEGLETTQLAYLGILVEIIGNGYFQMTKKEFVDM